MNGVLNLAILWVTNAAVTGRHAVVGRYPEFPARPARPSDMRQKRIVWISSISLHPRCSSALHYLEQYEIALISWNETQSWAFDPHLICHVPEKEDLDVEVQERLKRLEKRGAKLIFHRLSFLDRILNACFVVHWILAATSLLLQFLFPLRGVTHHVGNEQLWYRARIRALSVPLQISMGCLKPKLHGTPFQRSMLEPVINFLSAAVNCVVVWSLQRQWRTSGILDAVEAAAAAEAEDTATELEETSTSAALSLELEDEKV